MSRDVLNVYCEFLQVNPFYPLSPPKTMASLTCSDHPSRLLNRNSKIGPQIGPPPPLRWTTATAAEKEPRSEPKRFGCGGTV